MEARSITAWANVIDVVFNSSFPPNAILNIQDNELFFYLIRMQKKVTSPFEI